MAISNGVNRDLLLGIANDACCNLPASSQKSLNGTFGVLGHFLMSAQMSAHFFAGSWIVYSTC